LNIIVDSVPLNILW